MTDDPIADDEILYRRVLDGRDHYTVQNDGTIRVSSQAFYESGFRPSVDRAKLRDNDPKKTLGTFSGGVASLVTHDVRSVAPIVQNDEKGHFVQLCRVNVEYMPILNDPVEPDNDAHAEIYTNPPCNKRVFRKLIEKLALLANARPWEIKPSIKP